jgi:hypothetical protein
VVDFVPDGTPGRSNTADLCIAVGVVVLVTTLVRRHGEPLPPVARRISVRVWIAALIALIAVITLAVTGAIGPDGRHAPDRSSSVAAPDVSVRQAGEGRRDG